MGWFKKIFKAPTKKFRCGNYTCCYLNCLNTHDYPSTDTHAADARDATHTQRPSTSEEDTSNDQESKDLDRAIILSLLQENQEQTARADAKAMQKNRVLGNSKRQKNGITYDIGSAYGTGGSHGNGRMHGGGNAYRGEARICAGCDMDIGPGRYLIFIYARWYPQWFRCHGCGHPIFEDEFAYGYYPFHKACYKERHHPRCYVCSLFLPTNPNGLIEYMAHPFWLQKYCPSHEHDATPMCCSCERMKPRNIVYVGLGDGRKLCVQCLNLAVMKTSQCQPLYLEIQEFYKGLDMKVEQHVPLFLVGRQALEEAREGEKDVGRQKEFINGHYLETIGLCLLEELTVTEPFKVTSQRKVNSIHILFGLPRLLTGSIIAHEMMHAWMWLKGFGTLSRDVEEGICQVMGHMWLEAELAGGSRNSKAASKSSGSSSRGLNKRPISQYERNLGEFFKLEVESNSCPVYGDGFRAGRLAVGKYGLRKTLEHIQMTGRFPV